MYFLKSLAQNVDGVGANMNREINCWRTTDDELPNQSQIQDLTFSKWVQMAQNVSSLQLILEPTLYHFWVIVELTVWMLLHLAGLMAWLQFVSNIMTSGRSLLSWAGFSFTAAVGSGHLCTDHGCPAKFFFIGDKRLNDNSSTIQFGLHQLRAG